MSEVRPAAVAGAFYPRDPARLSDAVDKYLAEARALRTAAVHHCPAPKALIVPHAGYRFSGSIAAGAYARIDPIAERIKRVVLFGPSHRVPVRGLAIPSVEAFETPLGSVPLDREYLDVLKAQPYTEVSDAAHAPEHSLEVQVPFLQKTLGEFRLTPVLVGVAEGDSVADALRRVWGGPETLILVSSDLSHYHPYEDSQRRDAATSMAILSLSAGRLRSEDACGWRPVDGLLRRIRDTSLQPSTVDVRNSGDTASPHDRVVGYGSWAFTDCADSSYIPLDDPQKRELLRVAAVAVACAASGRPPPKVSVGTFAAPLQRPGAAFVTLTKNGRLRGCIGSLCAYRPLVLDVAERGSAAAVKDRRFRPVERSELRGMHLEVAVLTPPRTVEFRDESELIEQLRPERDGLIIEDRGRRATFLPKVWKEITEPPRFLQRLKQKAGLEADHWSPAFKAWRFQTDSFGADSPFD